MVVSRYALAAALAAAPLPAFAQMNMPGMTMPGMEMDQPAKSRWQIHSHTTLNLVADNQEGPRGGSKTFVAGMTMLMASHPLGDDDRIEFDAMLSPDAFMGKRGYPLLLQTGETADGVTPLTDRQHPHDLFMGLSARLTHNFPGGGAFIEAGYPGEFAFGPASFMHRPSGENFPTAPISHHWLDSGHITMGVITGGLSKGPLTLEISRFTGREPDQNRFDLDPLRLDSTAARLSWRVNDDLSVESSWAGQVSPEQLEPGVNLIKHAASLDYRHSFPGGTLNATVAWGRKKIEHGDAKPSDAWLIENNWHFNGPWIGLTRFERVYNEDLAARPAWVTKAEVGVMRVFTLNDDASIAFGLVRQFNGVPKFLEPAYGHNPDGTVAFVQIRLHAMKM